VTGATSGNGRATVSWTAARTNPDFPVTGYVVTPLIGTAAQTPTRFNSAATSEVVTGLTNGATYTFKVAAFNANGSGPPSAPGGAIVVGAPGVPTAVTATAGIGKATVHWTAPATDNGAAITGYVVTPFVNGVARTPQPFLSTATTQTINGLASGTTFVFRVAATNSRGTGLRSAPSNAVTVT